MSATEPAPSDRTTSKQDYGTPPEFLRAVEARFRANHKERREAEESK
jgi:hypothetical protein